jgi:hypothetical protein
MGFDIQMARIVCSSHQTGMGKYKENLKESEIAIVWICDGLELH